MSRPDERICRDCVSGIHDKCDNRYVGEGLIDCGCPCTNQWELPDPDPQPVPEWMVRGPKLVAERDAYASEVSRLTAENARLAPLVARMAKLGLEPGNTNTVDWFAEWADIAIACRGAAVAASAGTESEKR